MVPIRIQVQGKLIPRKFVSDAGHAVVVARSSTDPVSLSDKPGYTNEGKAADALCTVDFSQGPNESLTAFFERRIAYIYAGAIAEAAFEVTDDDVERHVLWLLEHDDDTDGPLVARICDFEMKALGITENEINSVRQNAWRSALSVVMENKDSIARVATAFHSRHELSNEQIRALLDPLGQSRS